MKTLLASPYSSIELQIDFEGPFIRPRHKSYTGKQTPFIDDQNFSQYDNDGETSSPYIPEYKPSERKTSDQRVDSTNISKSPVQKVKRTPVQTKKEAPTIRSRSRTAIHKNNTVATSKRKPNLRVDSSDDDQIPAEILKHRSEVEKSRNNAKYSSLINSNQDDQVTKSKPGPFRSQLGQKDNSLKAGNEANSSSIKQESFLMTDSNTQVQDKIIKRQIGSENANKFIVADESNSFHSKPATVDPTNNPFHDKDST